MKIIAMLVGVVLLGLVFFMFNSKSQNIELVDFNGWEFLNWEYDKTKVEEVLKEKGITFDPGAINQKQGPTTEFIYEDMETRLAYDLGHLYDVQQNKYFGADKKVEADAFFSSLKSKLIETYGKPLSEDDDIERKMLEIVWKLKYTVLSLDYFYDDTVVAGFEDETFSISVQANEVDE